MIIKSWLQECKYHAGDIHKDCQPVPFIPLRLVSVGLDGHPPRLVRGDQVQNTAQYTTLSHCWGGMVPIRTTKASVADLSVRIPLDALPATFADAIQLTLDLGIPYVWIDALCIVQDDKTEWEREAARMDSVYMGSQLNISAVQSSNSSQGCFLPYKTGLREGEGLFRAWPEGPDGPDRLIRMYRGDVRHRASSMTALSSRGWTLQEQLLSKRDVSCMRPEVHWRCQCYFATESGLRFSSKTMPPNSLPLQLPCNQHNWLPSASGDISGHRRWADIVENYSSRNFTFQQDRIAAIAGIVCHMMVELDDEFILGLWKKSFSRDLGWMRSQWKPNPAFQSLSESLPSWSWFGCQGQLMYDFWGWEEKSRRGVKQELHQHVSLIDWDVRWEGLPYVSTVSSAQLRIKCYISYIPIRLCDVGSASNPPYLQVFDEELGPSTSNGLWWRCVGQFDTVVETKAETYPCLLLRSRSIGDTYEEEFLILKPADTLKADSYRRIGLAKISGESPVFDMSSTHSIVLV
jgi:hypothetical protein